MHEVEMKLRDISEMKEKLVSLAKEALGSGCENVDCEELGEVVDMIKDLADAEKNCWKAAYYKSVVGAMEEGSGNMGYDHWRTSSGRFADKGTGHYSGYPMWLNDDYKPEMMAGQKTNVGAGQTSRYGYPYEEWKQAKMRNDRMGMDSKGEEHVQGMVQSVRDIWKDADPQLREKMKRELSALSEEMDL